MGATVAKAMHNMRHAQDPKKTLNDKLKGFIEAYHPLWNNVVCAIYVRPNQTASGLYLSEKREDEDIYQGNVGLVVALGPDAEKDGTIKIGDWVRFKPEEGDRFSLAGVPCREFELASIQGKLDLPDVIF